MFIGRTAAGPRVRGCRLRRREGGSRYGHTPPRGGHAYPAPTGETLGLGCQPCWRRFLLQAHVAQLWLGFRVLAADVRGERVVAGVGELGCWPVLACWPRRCSLALCGCGWCLCLSYGPRLPHDLREHATDGWSCRS